MARKQVGSVNGSTLFSFCLWLVVLLALPVCTQAQTRYEVQVRQLIPLQATIKATVPGTGTKLTMDTTRPGDLEELNSKGWPVLVSKFQVTDAAGNPVEVSEAGPAGWKLKEAATGPLNLRYDVDFSLLAAHDWPAPREAAFAQETTLVCVGRSLFVTAQESGPIQVTFELPSGWRVVAPWNPQAGKVNRFSVASQADLAENLIVLTKEAPEVVTSGGFSLQIACMGHWQPVRREVRQVLGSAMRHLVSLMKFTGRQQYLVVLLPMLDGGGEAFRHSFALTVEKAPTLADSSAWGNIIAHEIFHYWNGWRLRGKDYGSSQWFQEGFTEYVANNTMMAGGFLTPEEFRKKLARHVQNYHKLTTSMVAGGTRKGPPLYSGGALVAFLWDVKIREATQGQKNLGDFLRVLWKQTGQGREPYEWNDIKTALSVVAADDWETFFQQYIQGTTPLPLATGFASVGLRLEKASDDSFSLTADPGASPAAKKLWRTLTGSRQK
ncbi:MAG: hypothetical protein K1Y36_19275 [Blastocatellia bacterium]|nr:hypothetical protein [Blastocatellia bacterium]